jgi:hypothetical protein
LLIAADECLSSKGGAACLIAASSNASSNNGLSEASATVFACWRLWGSLIIGLILILGVGMVTSVKTDIVSLADGFPADLGLTARFDTFLGKSTGISSTDCLAARAFFFFFFCFLFLFFFALCGLTSSHAFFKGASGHHAASSASATIC